MYFFVVYGYGYTTKELQASQKYSPPWCCINFGRMEKWIPWMTLWESMSRTSAWKTLWGKDGAMTWSPSLKAWAVKRLKLTSPQLPWGGWPVSCQVRRTTVSVTDLTHRSLACIKIARSTVLCAVKIKKVIKVNCF